MSRLEEIISAATAAPIAGMSVTPTDRRFAVQTATDNTAVVLEVANTVLAFSKLGMALGGALLAGAAGLSQNK